MKASLSATRFSYENLSHQLAADLKAAATEIRRLHRQSFDNIIDAGNKLLSARERLNHGQFGDWIATEFGWTDRTARRYMLAAKWVSGKSDIVSGLELTAIYLLSSPSTPAAVGDDVVDRLHHGEHLTLPQIKSIVSDARPKPKAKAKKRSSLDVRQVAEKEPEAASQTMNTASRDAATKLANMIRERAVGDESVLFGLLEATTPQDLWSALRGALAKATVIDALADGTGLDGMQERECPAAAYQIAGAP
jgi:hypothetical protein